MTSKHYTIVLVDDEPNILSSLRRLLRALPTIHPVKIDSLSILTFTNPVEALGFIKTHHVDTVLSDFRMPELTGAQFLTEVSNIQPEATRLIMSGYADLNDLIESINRAHIERFIAKPWNDYEMLATISGALTLSDTRMETLNLADQARVNLKQITEEELSKRLLEREEPGLTHVEWDETGAIIIK